MIVGRLIPAGTGLAYHEQRRKAREALQLNLTVEPMMAEPEVTETEESPTDDVATD